MSAKKSNWSAEYGEKWRKNNPERLREYKKAYRKKWARANPERQRDKNRKETLRRHGITHADYVAMLDRQGGACAICGTKPDGNLRVDHNHATGRIRGLLCACCNQGIGLLRSDVLGRALFDSAIRYLGQ